MRDLFGGIRRVPDNDILRDDKRTDRIAIRVRIELARHLQEFQQIERCQIARGIVQMHVFGTRIGSVDAAGVGTGVPSIDRRIKLHARIRAVPGCFRDQMHQIARSYGVGNLARFDVS